MRTASKFRTVSNVLGPISSTLRPRQHGHAGVRRAAVMANSWPVYESA